MTVHVAPMIAAERRQIVKLTSKCFKEVLDSGKGKVVKHEVRDAKAAYWMAGMEKK